jgi:hypothetical protein
MFIMVTKTTVVNPVNPFAGVVVQMVEAPKAEYVLTTSQSGEVSVIVDNLLEAEDLLFDGQVKMETTAKALVKSLGTVEPTYVCFMAFRKCFIASVLRVRPKASEDTAQKKWEDLVKLAVAKENLIKPSSKSASAVSMSKTRAAKAEKLGKMVDSQLLELMAGFKAVDNFDEAGEIKAELVRREKLAGKDQESIVKELRADIAKRIKLVGNIDLLKKIQAMLPVAI